MGDIEAEPDYTSPEWLRKFILGTGARLDEHQIEVGAFAWASHGLACARMGLHVLAWASHVLAWASHVLAWASHGLRMDTSVKLARG